MKIKAIITIMLIMTITFYSSAIWITGNVNQISLQPYDPSTNSYNSSIMFIVNLTQYRIWKWQVGNNENEFSRLLSTLYLSKSLGITIGFDSDNPWKSIVINSFFFRLILKQFCGQICKKLNFRRNQINLEKKI